MSYNNSLTPEQIKHEELCALLLRKMNDVPGLRERRLTYQHVETEGPPVGSAVFDGRVHGQKVTTLS